MTDKTYTPQKISVQTLLKLRDQKTKPIDALVIPNITVPPHLVSKKRATETNNSLSVNIRQLFNSLTKENIALVKEKFRQVIVADTQSVEKLKEIANEILENFIISEMNIENYMHLLNSVSTACVLIAPSGTDSGPGKNVSPPLGNFFLQTCRDMIFEKIGEKNIRSLAELDQDDSDQLDKYTREREKIINLIITICCLYEQRHTAHVKLTAIQLYFLMNTIFTYHSQLQEKMKELGDPYESDCSNEEEYEICRKMCNLYAEQLYTFMSKKAREFSKDPELVKGQTLGELVNLFKTKIVPTITEEFLISKCQDIVF